MHILPAQIITQSLNKNRRADGITGEKKMKPIKLVSLFVCIISMIFFFSCSKDDNNGGSLVGTSWIYYYGSDRNEGSTIRFVSESVAYWTDWEYEHGEYVEDVDQVNYVYNAPNGVLTKLGRSMNFTINGNSLVLYLIFDGTSEVWTYNKQ